MTQTRRSNSVVIFNDAHRLSGSVVVSGRQFNLRGELPEGDFTSCQRLVVDVYGSDKGLVGSIELVATDDPFDHRPAFEGTGMIGHLTADFVVWRKFSAKAGKFLSGRVSFPFLTAA